MKPEPGNVFHGSTLKDVLRGREEELESLLCLVDGAYTGRSGAVVLRGARGAGRTALLGEAERRASGSVRVLQIAGVPAESALPFAAVHRLLRPLRQWTGGLPDPQRSALSSVFGWDGIEFDPYRISLGALTLLSSAADERPLLVLVDDADRLDRESADTLSFVARRLEGEPIAMVIATTPDPPGGWSGLPEVRLGPLSEEVARQVIAEHCPGAAAPVVERLVAEAAGNPQILIELCQAVPAGVRRGEQPLPEHLAPSGRLGQDLAGRVDRLPPDVQLALLVIAAENTGDLAVAATAAKALGIDEDALEAAITAGMLTVERHQLRWRPPVLRSVVYHRSPLPARVRAHRALVDALEHDCGRQVRHLAECTLGVDEPLADRLARTAHQHRRAGDHGTATELLHRAATLTVSAHRRADHLVWAAECAWLAGNLARADALLAVVPPAVVEAETLARIALLRGLREQCDGSPAAAYRILIDGAGPVLASHPDLAARMLSAAEHAAWLSGDLAGLAAVTAQRNALLASQGAAPTGQVTGSVTGSADGRRTDLLIRGRPAEHALHGQPDQWPPVGPASFMAALPGLIGAIEAGRWTHAEERLHAALRCRDGPGHANAACLSRSLLAWVAAMRGQAASCHQLATAALDLAYPRGLSLAGAIAQWSIGLLALGEGRIDDAIYQLQGLVPGRAPTGPSVIVLAAVSDLLEALVRARRQGDARQLLGELETEDVESWWQLPEALAQRCRALVAGRDGGKLFEDALRSPDLPPFEAARTRLVYGEWLRRHREVKTARIQLHTALDCFELLGAQPWAMRCRAELRAAGHAVTPGRNRTLPTPVALTPRELQIARSVAAGKSNREVAAALFISPRTVSDHLYKLFPKLGVSSRHQLRDLRLELDPYPDHQSLPD